MVVKYLRPDVSNSVRELSTAKMGTNPAHYKKMLKAIKLVIDTKDKALKFNVREKDNKMEN